MGKMAAILKLAGDPLCARKKKCGKYFFASLVSILQHIKILRTVAKKNATTHIMTKLPRLQWSSKVTMSLWFDQIVCLSVGRSMRKHT